MKFFVHPLEVKKLESGVGEIKSDRGLPDNKLIVCDMSPASLKAVCSLD